MKVYIHTDIEGVAGWVFYANAPVTSQANLEHTRRMNDLMTDEVVAACRAALDAGADTVWVNDAHGPAYSINFERLPSGCQIIHGRPGYFDQWLACMDASVDALICVGQHAMAGTRGSVCPHTLWHVNDGIQLSETTMAAALAGEFGVPMICVTGDDKINAECADKIPDIEQVIVKWGISAQNARSLCPKDACQRIYDGVRCAMARIDQIKPYTIAGPIRLNLSERDPAQKIMPEDVIGNNINDTVQALLNDAYAHYGEDPLDDKTFRYPL